MANIIFGDLLRDWWERYLLRGNVDYARESWKRLEREVLPALGNKDARKITPPMVLAILRRIEARGTLVAARKIKCHISQAMRYGIACGYVQSDPTRDLGWAMMPHKSVPRATIIEPAEIGQLMKRISEYRYRKRRVSLRLLALTFVRPGELSKAEWKEIEWERAVWKIPAEKMKMKRPHVVPLSRQAIEALRALQTLTGKSRWLLPSSNTPASHDRAHVFTYALRSMGYSKQTLTAHGFRAMAATILSDQGWASEVIERQLAHLDKNRVRAAYQRSELLGERARMMQAWADYLDQLKALHRYPSTS